MPANTYGIATAILTMAQTAQVNSQPAYANGRVGQYKDITGLVPTLEVVGADDETHRMSMLNRDNAFAIDDSQTFWVVSTVDNTDSGIAEQSIMAIRDAATELFHASKALNFAGVFFSAVEPAGTYEYTFRNGVWWRAHRFKVRVRYEYAATATA